MHTTDFTSKVEETSKTAKIKNAAGQLRFVIILDEDIEKGWFFVKVDKHEYDETTDPPHHVKTELIYETHLDVSAANAAFSRYVSEYKTLVNAEDRGWQDIRIYDDQVKYRKICADCCKVCFFAYPLLKDGKSHCHVPGPYEKKMFRCLNPRITKIRVDLDEHDPEFETTISNAPLVIEDGICKDFKRKLDPKYRKPGQSDADWYIHTNKDLDNQLDAEIQYEVNKKMDEKLNNIKIEKIVGNDNDANQNGIDDDEEKRNGLGEVNDFIIGGLGADE